MTVNDLENASSKMLKKQKGKKIRSSSFMF